MEEIEKQREEFMQNHRERMNSFVDELDTIIKESNERSKTMAEERMNATKEAKERAALMDDPNYKRFAEAAETSANNIRNMSDYEYKEFVSKLREARVTKMPWWKRAWHAITDDVDAAMATWMFLTLGTAAGVGVAVGKAAKKNAAIELRNQKKRLEENFNQEKKAEIKDIIIDDVRTQVNWMEDKAIPLSADMIAVRKDQYDKIVSDANINICELKNIVGATDIPSVETYANSHLLEERYD